MNDFIYQNIKMIQGNAKFGSVKRKLFKGVLMKLTTLAINANLNLIETFYPNWVIFDFYHFKGWDGVLKKQKVFEINKKKEVKSR